MNNVNRVNADKILRHVFELKKENKFEKLDAICDVEGIEQSEGTFLFNYLNSKDLVEVWAKGDGRNENDFYVALTKSGFVFFSEDNLVDQYARKHVIIKPNLTHQNNYHIAGDANNFGNTATNSNVNSVNEINPAPEKEKWFNKIFKDTTSQIISSLIVAGLLALITWYLNKA